MLCRFQVILALWPRVYGELANFWNLACYQCFPAQTGCRGFFQHLRGWGKITATEDGTEEQKPSKLDIYVPEFPHASRAEDLGLNLFVPSLLETLCPWYAEAMAEKRAGECALKFHVDEYEIMWNVRMSADKLTAFLR